VKLPFGKKSGGSQSKESGASQSKGSKNVSRASRKQGVESNPNWGSPGVPESALARPRRQGNHWENEWQHPAAEPELPGICGYLNGVKKHEKGYHPSRFVYVRPDGQPDAQKHNEVVPSRASTRPVPRGFFGP
jgi:hypothetical protein